MSDTSKKAFFSGFAGDIRQNYINLLSVWGTDEDSAYGFYDGFFAAMKAFGITCPVDINDAHARAIWATRWLLATVFKPEGKIELLPGVVMADNEELQKAHRILQHLQFDTDTAKSFIGGAVIESDDPLSHPSTVYYNPDQPDVIYDNCNDSDITDEIRRKLLKVNILHVNFDDGADFIIRSDDSIMMRALTEQLYGS